MEGLLDNFVPSELVAKLFQLCECSSSSIIKVKRAGKRGWQVKLNFSEKCDEGPVDGVPENTVIKYRRVSQFQSKRDFKRLNDFKDNNSQVARLIECLEPENIAKDSAEIMPVTPTVPLHEDIPEVSPLVVSEQAHLHVERVQQTPPSPGGASFLEKSSELCSRRSPDVLPKSKAQVIALPDVSPPDFNTHIILCTPKPPDCDSLLVKASPSPKLISEPLDSKPEPEPPDSHTGKNGRSSHHSDLMDKFFPPKLLLGWPLTDEERADLMASLNID